MKVMAMREYGAPQVLQPMDLPTPQPGHGEVLIRVVAIGVNPADWKWRQGMFAGFMPVTFPYVPGYDIAGVIEQGGHLAPGTRVVAMLDNLKAGAYAEYAVVHADTIAVMPDDLDFVTAAALPCPGLTGLQIIDEYAQPRPGDTVVITGATGAVGRFALYAAKRRGATVVAAVREAHRQAALDIGADQAIALDRADLAVGSNHLVDTVGGRQVAAWAQKVKSGGKILTAATDPIPDEDLHSAPIFTRVHVDAAQLGEIARAVAERRLAIPAIETWPLVQAAQAHALL